MIGLLALIFWLTITGANYPSALLSSLFFSFQEKLTAAFMASQCAPMAPRDSGSGCIPGTGLGYLCHASAHGHFLPSLYPFGRFWLSAPDRI